ncbi:hypothetical protein H6758_04495 [Candidatus Nomurabacteria bacterium]|nr:hypothetical protein [Candidatus Nomurabacteria bacterium]
MSQVTRKKGESFEGFMRRVKRSWLSSGKILQARKVMFFQKKKSKNLTKTGAVRGLKKASKIQYLQKTGKLPPDMGRRGNRRR